MKIEMHLAQAGASNTNYNSSIKGRVNASKEEAISI